MIVPDFGGFVANYKPAAILERERKILPPSKSVLFNPHLLNNDGLLANAVAGEQKCTFPQALEMIRTAVLKWQKKLDDGDRVELEELGFLYKQNNCIHFEQSREMNLLLSAYGLSAVEFVFYDQQLKTAQSAIETKAVIRPEKIEVRQEHPEKLTSVEEEKSQKEVAVFNLNPVIEIVEKPEPTIANSNQDTVVVSVQRNRFKSVMKYAVAAAIVPFLFYSYWIPMETDALDTGSIQLSDFNPIHSQVKKVYRPRTEEIFFEEIQEAETWSELTAEIDAEVYSYELTEDFYIPVQLHKESTFVDQTLSELQADNNLEDISQSSQNYQVIAGCFSIEDNAQNLIEDLRAAGFTANIHDQKGGLHRVTAGGFSDREAAKTELEKVKSLGFSGWILKK